MRERAVKFGKSQTLVGVVAEPRSSSTSDRPAVLLLNSGILHHVGAGRLYVRIARALAEDGFTVLRFDHSGIGDSDTRRESLPFEKSAILDAQEAMDHLSARGHRRFATIGLCSGADMSFRVAGVDPRIVALVQLDAWAYRTPGYHVRHYAKRLFRAAAWRGFLRGRMRVLSTALGAPPPSGRTVDMETTEYRRVFPPRDTVARDLRALVERGAKLLYFFSGGQEEHYNHRTQYATSFADVDFRGGLQVEYLEDADHLFSALDHQAFVVRRIREWMGQLWGGVAQTNGTPAGVAAAPALRVPSPGAPAGASR